MATYQDGDRRRATANTKHSLRLRAERHQCPKCNRKAAVVHSAELRMTYCRWADRRPPLCDYVRQWDE